MNMWSYTSTPPNILHSLVCVLSVPCDVFFKKYMQRVLIVFVSTVESNLTKLAFFIFATLNGDRYSKVCESLRVVGDKRTYVYFVCGMFYCVLTTLGL
jgi:hypothetical protein